MNIVRESKDVFDLSYLHQTWFITPMLLLAYGIVLFTFYHRPMIKIKWIWLLLIYMAAHKPYRAYTASKDMWYFQPSITRPTLKNSISTFSFFVFQYYPRGYTQVSINYKPYDLSPISSDTQNILLIWGESLYSNHIQMYGYNRVTFPLMQNRIQHDPLWQQYQAISGGIATATSTLLFFNLLREPANHYELKTYTANLFKIAKSNGFKTYYLSNQESRLTMNLGTKYIDVIKTNDSEPILFGKYKDEGLVSLLEKIDLSKGKNFVVLHMRSPHSPYENRYKGREAEFEKFIPAANSKNRDEYTINTYDNALLYTDYVIDQMIATFEKLNGKNNSSIYITADHGQLFDYHGMWAHNNLVIEQGMVPFWVKTTKNLMLNQNTLSHYQIGKIIAKDLGAEVINPNEDRTFYMHANNIDYPYNFIKYEIINNQPIELEKKNTAEPTK